MGSAGESAEPSVAVAIPTRSRPALLARCLEHLAAARDLRPFEAYVCDSSPDEASRAAGRDACARYDWAHWSAHDGANVAAARNACARAAHEDLLINVDDDLEVEPESIRRLVDLYRRGSGRRVVSGSVSWGDDWTAPMKMRPIGYARLPRPGERPDFVLGAFFLYPRAFAVTWPWNERIVTSDDIFMGALWRAKGVELLFAPDARARHPEVPTGFDADRIGQTVDHQRWHVYALMFDALVANPSLRRALSYELLGFAASAKLYFRRPAWAVRFVWSWIAGNARLLADLPYLRSLVAAEAPAR